MTLEIGLLNKENSGLLSSYPSPIALPFNKMMGFLSQPERLVVIPYLPTLAIFEEACLGLVQSTILYCIWLVYPFVLLAFFYVAINLMHFVGLMSIGRN